MLSAEIKKIFHGGSLSERESRSVIEKITLEGISDVQITTLLTLLAQRGATVEELIGFAQGMRDKIIPVGDKGNLPPILDTCGTGGDGKQTFNVSTLSALVLSAYGIKTAKHGNRFITSKCGSADLLEGLGMRLDIPVDRIIPCLKTVGMVFFFAPLFHPVMKILGPIRKNMGIPTLFNSMGPLLNPIQADYQVMGIYYPNTEKIACVLQALGIKGGMVVNGYDGIDEISPCAPTKITEFTSGKMNTYDFNPWDYGVTGILEHEIQGGDLDINLQIAREVLDPQKPLTPSKSFVILNAAAGIRVVKGYDYKEALTIAEEVLQSGEHRENLKN